MGDVRWFHDGMPLSGRVVASRMTVLGRRYWIRVLWNNGRYTDFTRLWFRTWTQ